MLKEILKELPWGWFAVIILFQLALLAGVVAGATWIVRAIWF